MRGAVACMSVVHVNHAFGTLVAHAGAVFGVARDWRRLAQHTIGRTLCVARVVELARWASQAKALSAGMCCGREMTADGRVRGGGAGEGRSCRERL